MSRFDPTRTKVSKYCPLCKQEKSAFAFNRGSGYDGLHSRCRSCNREERKQWGLKNPERELDKHFRRQFNIGYDVYASLLERQAGLCAVCSETCKTGQRLSVDHCHKTGTVRALLCRRCNSAIGLLDDDTDKARGLLAYLQEHEE